MSQSKKQKNSSSIKLVSIILTLVVMALYAGYWFSMARSIETAIINWKDTQNKSNAELAFETISTSGFPFEIKIAVKNITTTQPDDSKWHIPEFNIISNPLIPNSIRLLAPQKNTFTTGEKAPFPLVMSFDNFGIQNLYSPVISKQNVTFTASSITISQENTKAEKPISPMTIDDILVELLITPPLTKPISTTQEAKEWAQNDGQIDINSFLIKSKGISFDLSGTASLTDELKPTLKGEVSILGVIELLTRLREEKIISDTMAVMVTGFIKMLNDGKEPQEDQPVIAPITTNKSGVIFIGSLPIISIPEIQWSDTPSKSE